jgi:hypothetical protein
MTATPANTTTANTTERLLSIGEDNLVAAEARDAYKDAGPLYAGVNVMGDLGVELGFSTGSVEKGTIQRSGVGFYLRSDHIAHRKVRSILHD